jgi:hypothetical protein
MIGMDNYLMFHCLSELFSISVAGCVFAITWSTRMHRPKDSSFFLLIGIGSLFVGGIDLVHTLAYKGMNLIPGYDSDLPTQLWIAARYLQSLSFMAASGLLVTLAIKHDPSTGAVCLRVRDNGIGLPVDLDWRKSESLGLRLVQMLTAQMHGTVHADYGSHTEFQINFNLNEIPS